MALTISSSVFYGKLSWSSLLKYSSQVPLWFLLYSRLARALQVLQHRRVLQIVILVNFNFKMNVIRHWWPFMSAFLDTREDQIRSFMIKSEDFLISIRSSIAPFPFGWSIWSFFAQVSESLGSKHRSQPVFCGFLQVSLILFVFAAYCFGIYADTTVNVS